MKHVKDLRQEHALSQKELADRLGVSRSTVAMWETSSSQPDLHTLAALADLFQVSVDYLLGRVSTPAPSGDAVEKILAPQSVVPGGMAPVVGSVRCGWDGTIDAQMTGEYEPVYQEDTSDLVWMHARGDSMEPLIHDGDKVLVRLQNTVENGEIAVCIINDEEGTIKKVQRSREGVMLIPLNDRYNHIFIPARSQVNLRIYGKVLHAVTQLG